MSFYPLKTDNRCKMSENYLYEMESNKMNGKIYNGNEAKELSPKLVSVLAVIFAPASAKASVSGEARDMAATVFAQHVPAMGKFTKIELTDEDGIITIQADGLVNALTKVVEAYRKMEAVRAELEAHEQAYKSVRSYVATNPSDGKRGRKPADLASRYALD
jgi:hypothetical protein